LQPNFNRLDWLARNLRDGGGDSSQCQAQREDSRGMTCPHIFRHILKKFDVKPIF
jgi:hypothetical protein